MTLPLGPPTSVIGAFGGVKGDYIIKCAYINEPIISPFSTINMDGVFRFTTSEEEVDMKQLIINSDSVTEVTSTLMIDSKKPKKNIKTLELSLIGIGCGLGNEDSVLVSYKIYIYDPTSSDLIQRVYIDQMSSDTFEKLTEQAIPSNPEEADPVMYHTQDKCWYIQEAFAGRYSQGSKSV